MDKMSLVGVLAVSAPEAIFDICIGMLLIGEKKKLMPNLTNLLRMISAVAIMLLSTVLIRSLSPIGAISILLHIFLYIPVLKYIYKIGWDKAFVCVISFMAILVIIEFLYMPISIAYIFKRFDKVLETDGLRILCSLPERLIQLTIILQLFNMRMVLINIRKFNKIRYLAIPLIILSAIAPGVMWYGLIYGLNMDSIFITSIFILSIIITVLTNLLVFRLIIEFTKTVSLDIINLKERDNVIEIISRCISVGQLKKAKDIAEKFIKKVV